MDGRSKLALWLTVLLAMIITVLTLAPVSLPVLESVPHPDKIYHMLAFFGLTLPISFYRSGWLFAAIPAFAIFGGVIEVIQPVFSRECSFLDWLADLAGIAAGVMIGRASAVLTGTVLRP